VSRILFSPLLALAAFVFVLVRFLRGKFYDWGILKSASVPARVICVGNLTAGGTGKTPLIRWLAGEISGREKKVCVLSRGYGRSSAGIFRVDPASLAQDVGDEPLQLARQLPGIPVYVGARRLEAARQIVAAENPDVILLDDGFQHRRLKRDLDLVVLDATQPRWQYLPLPLGLGRESFRALGRASAVVMTKINLAESRGISTPKDRPVFKFSFVLSGARDFSGSALGLASLTGKKAALLTAIGRPGNFEKQVRELGVDVVEHRMFPDHHSFSAEEVKMFIRRARERGAERILVTEKDAVKLQPLDFPKDDVLILDAEMKIVDGKEELDRLVFGIFS
jgi:tetraacyldisaccharide 4'-kinase